MRQPIIWGVKGGFKSVYESFRKGECRAAVFRTTFYKKKLNDIDRANMRVLYKSKALPNQAISVSPRVDSKYKKEIIRSLTLDEKGKQAALGITKRFGGKKAPPFTAAKQDEYTEHSSLLEGVVFGW